MQFTKAPEPTDIIWENRFLTDYKTIIYRELLAYGIIMVILLLSFAAIYHVAVT